MDEIAMFGIGGVVATLVVVAGFMYFIISKMNGR